MIKKIPPKNRRIAFGITDLDVGGAERILVELTLRLHQRGWSPQVVCIQPAGPLARVLVDAGIPTQSLEARSLRTIAFAAWRWQRWLRRQKPVLLQTFLFHANLLGRLVGRWAGVPHIVGGIRVAERRFHWPHLLDRCTHWLADGQICVSAGVRDFYAACTGIPRNRLWVIPNGVDRTSLSTNTPLDLTPWNVLPHHRVLLFLGRLDPQKAPLDLIAALQQLALAVPLADRVRVFFVGAGPQREEVERAIREAGLENVTKVIGWHPHPGAWIAAADALILPSHWEGMPNVVLEAMAAGRPVIGTAVEGTSDLVIPGETGWLVPPADPARLAKAILEFLSLPDRGQSLGQAGKTRVANFFTLDAMVNHYESLYHQFISR